MRQLKNGWMTQLASDRWSGKR